MPDDTDLLDEPGHALDDRGGQGHGVNGSAEKSPHLELEGFSGRLEQMLFLARAQKLDLAKLSLQEFVEQLMGALRREVPINQKAEWVGSKRCSAALTRLSFSWALPPPNARASMRRSAPGASR